MSIYERTQMLLGDKKLETLKKSRVIVFGIGGVGGYVCEILARTGIGEITIVDNDVVTKSNINRQIIALNSTLNKPKVEVMKKRLLDINPQIKVNNYYISFDKDTQEEFDLTSYDYVVDAIDLINQKLNLIVYAKSLNAKIISSMGAGNLSGIPNFIVEDIFKTTYDGLARKLRVKLKAQNIKDLTVVYTPEQRKKLNPTASVAYYPAVCGTVIASYVINELIK
jgi:tRNA A37 threonylcarbamoyladenosine dehydratase